METLVGQSILICQANHECMQLTTYSKANLFLIVHFSIYLFSNDYQNPQLIFTNLTIVCHKFKGFQFITKVAS